MFLFFKTLWHSLLSFAFYYPLFMSYLWMIGAILFYWRNERKQGSYQQPTPLANTPPVSVLIPCYNEGDNAEETLTHALALDYPEFEVIAINDGSKDNTAEVLDRLATQYPRLRVVHLAQNQGKAMALQAGSLLANYEILICIDGDALLDKHAAHWMVKHFVEDAEVAAVTGNPRIRNRSTLLGRVQVGEFSSIVGMIKRAQRSFGRLFTVSGVITAFRKSAVHQVGYWSPDMLTEDIDITWKLQRDGWDVRFEPHALVWILMPETLEGLWKQRLRWAMGGAQVLIKNLDVIKSPIHNHLWPLMLELCLSLLWSYAMLIMFVLWLLSFILPLSIPFVGSPLIPDEGALLLGTTCLLQFALSKWLDSGYDKGLGRNYYWMIWYPLVFWLINICSTIVAFPKVILLGKGQRARWVSPDRGIKPHS
ncbi:MAG TPA: poly-beta-1,6-N-acetyl-D-glucosamine synthase [Agitococcus sp.]|nr:poly-beta-1,6-N-acetyl-D-glucosamine synthase [Agitococcus sp.]HMV60617.1 poly-beta-1,6-N-acetyl-D-glucosamine synthase [Agitococcus sp.]HMX98503.1 poly-beta-1,6-N-acetyl-D-glucosamine synthase [Agitococcus sp.]HMY28116.1 poly-beta-1,6-N-acetyl-D-glucosamine synthase [Agitococcus sp.]HMY82400.1 poly-beta-1,6-N-acetyl-D-glucosamine synthase [Agitococcus sp.]